MAADYPNGGNGSTPAANTTTQVQASTQTSTLPLTGGDVMGLAAIGVGAALAGTVLVRRSRRTADSV
jgi:LPXTG-motif cell wall-anchored protein